MLSNFAQPFLTGFFQCNIRRNAAVKSFHNVGLVLLRRCQLCDYLSVACDENILRCCHKKIFIKIGFKFRYGDKHKARLLYLQYLQVK